MYLYHFANLFFYARALIHIIVTFKDPLITLQKLRNQKYPIHITTRKNKEIIIHNKLELSIILKGLTNWIKFESTTMILNVKNHYLKFSDHKTIDLDIFFKKLYSKLPVSGKVVIDIGGNVGDSALLYSILNAKKIVMIEPQPKFFQSAKRNIELNNMLNKIDLFNCAISKDSGYMWLNYESSDKKFEITEDKEKGIKIPKITLEELLSKYDEKTFVLKMDCEGCEYDVLLSASEEVLKKFNYILIEFHSGFVNISKKLKNCGFTVKLLNSRYTPKKSFRGHILAKKRL